MMISIEHLGLSWNELMKLPIYQRRFMLMKKKERYDEKEEELSELSQNKNGKNSYSGEALKQKMKNNEIPN